MKAIILKQYGPPGNLEIEQVEKPEPKAGEVLVRVHATSINDWDWGLVRGNPYIIRMLYGLKKPKIRIPGVDISGEIEAVGSSVGSFKPGDAIYCDLSECGFGGFAEYVCVPEKMVLLKPSGISHAEAAALPHAGLLAWQGLVNQGKVKSGQNILINGAGGGVGTLGIQILKPCDVKVTGVDTAAKFDLMRSLGFDHVIDYKKTDFTQTGEKYDLILDAKTNRPAFKYARCLNKNGRYVTIGGFMHRILEVVLAGSLISPFTDKKLSLLSLKANYGLDKISELVENGKLKPVVDGPYKLDEIPALIQCLGEGKHLGKIVVEVTT